VKVMGIEIPQSVVDATTARMREKSFTLLDIKVVARSAAEGTSAMECPPLQRSEFFEKIAGRVIQEKRKAGHIRRGRGKFWRWVVDEVSGGPS
jgi:hypothetical protein